MGEMTSKNSQKHATETRSDCTRSARADHPRASAKSQRPAHPGHRQGPDRVLPLCSEEVEEEAGPDPNQRLTEAWGRELPGSTQFRLQPGAGAPSGPLSA